MQVPVDHREAACTLATIIRSSFGLTKPNDDLIIMTTSGDESGFVRCVIISGLT